MKALILMSRPKVGVSKDGPRLGLCPVAIRYRPEPG
jgi:hypothetical protein